MAPTWNNSAFFHLHREVTLLPRWLQLVSTSSLSLFRRHFPAPVQPTRSGDSKDGPGGHDPPKVLLGLPVFFLIYRSSSFGWHRSYTYTVDNFVGPPTFSLAPQCSPHFFNSRIATAYTPCLCFPLFASLFLFGMTVHEPNDFQPHDTFPHLRNCTPKLPRIPHPAPPLLFMW